MVDMCRRSEVEEAKENYLLKILLALSRQMAFCQKKTTCMDAIKKKGELFISMVESFYGSTISDPVISVDYFCIAWDTDIQMKTEARKIMSELCVYKTRAGKIISEQFFY